MLAIINIAYYSLVAHHLRTLFIQHPVNDYYFVKGSAKASLKEMLTVCIKIIHDIKGH